MLEKDGPEAAAELAVEAMLLKPKEGWEAAFPNEKPEFEVPTEEEVVLVAGGDDKAARGAVEALDELEKERALPNENEEVEESDNEEERGFPVVPVNEEEEDEAKKGKDGVVAAEDESPLPNKGVVAWEDEAVLAAPNKGESVAWEEEAEGGAPKIDEGAEAADDPKPKWGADEPAPRLGFGTQAVAEVAAAADEEMFKENPDPGRDEFVMEDEVLNENDETGAEKEEVVTMVAAGAEVEPKENDKGLAADDPDKKLVVVATDALGFDDDPKRGEEFPKEKALEDEEEEPNRLGFEAAAAEPKGKDNEVGLGEAAVAEEEEKRDEEAEEREKGEDEEAKELEDEKKEKPWAWEDDEEEEDAEGLKEKGDAIETAPLLPFE